MTAWTERHAPAPDNGVADEDHQSMHEEGTA
jgi:hypothetical protein